MGQFWGLFGPRKCIVGQFCVVCCQKNQQRHHSTTAAADCYATDWSVSHHVVPPVNNLPRAMQPFAKIIWPTCLLFAIFHGTELPIKCRRAVKKLPAHCVLEQQDRALQMDGRTDRQKVAQSPPVGGLHSKLSIAEQNTQRQEHPVRIIRLATTWQLFDYFVLDRVFWSTSRRRQHRTRLD